MMTDEQLTWDGIYKSLVEQHNNGLSYESGIVNCSNLAEHLDTLYDKIAELETRLAQLE
jgi:hypothetical protein